MPLQLDSTINEYANSFDKIKKYKQHVSDKMQYYDLMLSDYYHLFEFGKFPAHILSQLHKEFVACLKERRKYKNEHAKLCHIESKLKSKGFNTDILTGTYGGINYNPNVLKEQFEKYKKYIENGD